MTAKRNCRPPACFRNRDAAGEIVGSGGSPLARAGPNCRERRIYEHTDVQSIN
jgi:hypothetical protein